MIRVRLMPPLRRLVGEKEIVLEGVRAPMKAVLQQAAAQNPRFQLAVLDAKGSLSSEYACLVNGRPYNVADLDGLEVEERDDIVILMPIAGGRGGGPQANPTQGALPWMRARNC